MDAEEQTAVPPSLDDSVSSADKPDAIIELPPEFAKAAEQLKGSPELLKLFVAQLSYKSTTTFGPDPETAKIIAQTEMHEEDRRLEGYRETLKSRDLQNQRDHERKEGQGKRDHEFRLKRLNYQTFLSVFAMLAAMGAGGVGLYLTTHGNASVGSNLLVGSGAALLFMMGGKNPFAKSD